MWRNRGLSVREFLLVTKALADENRLRAICVLAGRELCLCQIVELLGLAPSTVSKHMSILHAARLVESRKKGRWVYFRLAGDDAPPEAREALDWALKHMRRTSEAKEDAQRLKQILKMDPEELCRRQSGR